MLTIGGRIELNDWKGFAVAGGSETYAGNPDSRPPKLTIVSAHTTNDAVEDPRYYAYGVSLVADEEDKTYYDDAFSENVWDITHDSDPRWTLSGFRVYPDGIELRYVNENLASRTAIIAGHHRFTMDITVPVSHETGCPVETFQIEVGSHNDEYHSTVRRSSEPHRVYHLWYGESHPAPRGRFARWLSKKLFPAYYCTSDSSYFGQQYPSEKQVFLEIIDESPISAKPQKVQKAKKAKKKKK